MRILMALAACLALASCFTSDEAFYAEREGACPVRTATTYGIQQIDVGGRFSDFAAFTIAPDGRYCVRRAEHTPNAEAERALLIAWENGWYIVQRERDGTDESATGGRFLYQLARFEADRAEIYMPGCTDFTPAALTELGVEQVSMDAPEPPPAVTPPPRTKHLADGGKQDDGGESTQSPICRVTSRAQLESVLRRWITLERAPSESGQRMN